MKLALATDHAGFEHLKDLQAYLEELGYECQNFGPKTLQPDDDYPDFIFPAAKAVASGQCQRGIVFGRSGEGEAMAANRIKGIRCAVFYGPVVPKQVVDAHGNTSKNPFEILILSREHNNANMLSIGSSFLSFQDIKNAVKIWLESPYNDEARHTRRNQKLDQYE